MRTYSGEAGNLVPVRETTKHTHTGEAHAEYTVPAKAVTSSAVQLLLLLLLLLLLMLGLLLLLLLSLMLLLNKGIRRARANLSGDRRSRGVDGGGIKRASKARRG